jgi:hypothetical protein
MNVINMSKFFTRNCTLYISSFSIIAFHVHPLYRFLKRGSSATLAVLPNKGEVYTKTEKQTEKMEDPVDYCKLGKLLEDQEMEVMLVL